MPNYAPNSTGLLAPIQHFLDDNEISEIIVNRPCQVYIEKYGQLKVHDVPKFNERTLYSLFQLIANENNQDLSEKTPLLSGSLEDGARVQLVLPPTARYPTLSIRRKVAKKMTLYHYQDQNFYKVAAPHCINSSAIENLSDNDKHLFKLYQQKEWDKFIRNAIKFHKNIVISGGTSSGKTTYLNACLREIDLNDRIIILEDTREIETPHPNQVQLLATKGDQGITKVTMQELVQCCLRLRPDRIIMGEIRGAEILDFVSACSTGHEGSLTTIHANNPKVAFMRMTQMYKLNNVPSMTDNDIMQLLNEVVDIIVQIEKTKHGRQVQSIYYKYGSILNASPTC